jgi:ADP-heptose:LPS heptosyltransferase
VTGRDRREVRDDLAGSPATGHESLAEWAHARNILVVRLDNLGDVLMTGPALRVLKAQLPDCRITMLASPGGARAAELLPWVDRVLAHRSLWQDLGSPSAEPERQQRLIEALAAEAFDAALILTSFSQTPHAAGYACYLAGIPLRAGASKEFGGAVLTHELRMGNEHDGLHQVDRNLALLEHLGFDVSGLQPNAARLEVAIPDSARQALALKLADQAMAAAAPYLVACPWASCPARTYPPAQMVEAASAIATAQGWRVALTGMERHRDEGCGLMEILGEQGVDLVGRLEFDEFAALVQRSRLVLTNNSGPLHLAEATGARALVLYAGTELESQWAPRFTEARLLRRPTTCQPCHAFNCPIEGHPCLAIPADEVIVAGLELTGATQGAAHA